MGLFWRSCEFQSGYTVFKKKKAHKHGQTFLGAAAKEWEMLPVLRPWQEEWHLIRQREPIHFFNSLQVQRMGTRCFNKQWGERNSNMHQCRLNTSDSCPPGKFRVRVRTRRVRDQVAGTQTRPALSPTLQGACLTEKGEKTEEEEEEAWKQDGRRSRAEQQGRSEKVGKACKQIWWAEQNHTIPLPLLFSIV